RLLAPRMCGDALYRQIDFDEALGEGHVGSLVLQIESAASTAAAISFSLVWHPFSAKSVNKPWRHSSSNSSGVGRPGGGACSIQPCEKLNAIPSGSYLNGLSRRIKRWLTCAS